eukprot:4677830-Amphidinium_carterae.1
MPFKRSVGSNSPRVRSPSRKPTHEVDLSRLCSASPADHSLCSCKFLGGDGRELREVELGWITSSVAVRPQSTPRAKRLGLQASA